MTRLRFLLLLFALGSLGVMVTVFHPAAEEVEESDKEAVSESELQMYINVYEAMQDDHDLTIDEAIKRYNVSLDDFRQVERRIQSQARLVDRVREALLENARAHSVFAEAVATPTPPPTPLKQKPPHKGKN
jgi:ABC-type transport system involved in cytochrome bd biosynthesis fused ATPase/permease subunit